MLWRTRNPQRAVRSAPPGFIHPCRPTLSQKAPSGPGWAHEVKHDGYRLQVHVRGGRVRLFTMHGADWTERYPRIVEDAVRLKVNAIIDAEVICADAEGRADFDRLHSRCFEEAAIACAFDLLKLDDIDLRRLPLVIRKEKLRKLLARTRDGIQFVKHVEMDGGAAFAAACDAGLERIVSKRLTATYKSGPCKSWVKTRNPKSPAYLRVRDGSTG